MKAAVLGATGYTGLVLLRLLARHPEVTSLLPVSSSHAGMAARDVDPGLAPGIEERMPRSGGKFLSIKEAIAEAEGPGIDVVFAGLPHLKSAEICLPFMGRSVVIDLSADFRFKDPEAFARAYGAPPPEPRLLGKAVYGLAEWHREEIVKTDLIAQPGCYPTAVLLPLLPLAKAGVLAGTAVANAISGISGAGKKERADLLFSERTENIGAYNPGRSHRHEPEMEQELLQADPSLGLLFTPHLAPLKRGMVATTVVALKPGVPETGAGSVGDIMEKRYGREPFIALTGKRAPQSRDVWGSNRCDIGWQREGDHLLLFSAIDNLVKGASGNAVQCMNIRFGLPEDAGLQAYGEL
jgi:N-acetyl-gamma-glutamyl-phosphate reductase